MTVKTIILEAAPACRQQLCGGSSRLLHCWLRLATDSSSSSSTFLGMISMIGTHYTDSTVTTGFGNHLARPLFREKQSDDMTEDAAVELMHEALRVCYYRCV